MIMKRNFLIIVVLYITTIILAQAQNNSNKNYKGFKYSYSPDTIHVKVVKIAFITNDTIFDTFMIFDTLGIFYTFGSKKRLDEYMKSQAGVFIYEDDKILGTGNYIRIFKDNNETDTIYSYRNAEVDYYEGENLIEDNLGIPLIEYDIEHSYILQQMYQNISSQYIYCLINDGTKRFYGIHPSNYLKSSVLLKIDTTQDTTYNFFRYRAQSRSCQGMELISQDSVIMPLKKLKRNKWIHNNMDELLATTGIPDVYSNNYERTFVLLVTRRRFVVSTFQDPKKVDRWVNLVLSISYTLEQIYPD